MAAEKDKGAAQPAAAVIAVPTPLSVGPAGGVRLEVPPGVTSVGVGGLQFPVADGWVEVPEALAKAARAHLASLWRAIEREAKRAEAALAAAAERAKMPDWARRWTEDVERKLRGR